MVKAWKSGGGRHELGSHLRDKIGPGKHMEAGWSEGLITYGREVDPASGSRGGFGWQRDFVWV